MIRNLDARSHFSDQRLYQDLRIGSGLLVIHSESDLRHNQ
jgi:hypothetical protein